MGQLWDKTTWPGQAGGRRGKIQDTIRVVFMEDSFVLASSHPSQIHDLETAGCVEVREGNVLQQFSPKVKAVLTKR